MPCPIQSNEPTLFFIKEDSITYLNSFTKGKIKNYQHYYQNSNMFYKIMSDFLNHEENEFSEKKFLITNKYWQYLKLRDTYDIRFIPFFELFRLDHYKSISVEEYFKTNGCVYFFNTSNCSYVYEPVKPELLTDSEFDDILSYFDYIYIKPYSVFSRNFNKLENLISKMNKRFTIVYEKDDQDINNSIFTKTIISNNYIISHNMNDDENLFFSMINNVNNYNDLKLFWFSHNVETENFFNSLIYIYKPNINEIVNLKNNLYCWSINCANYLKKQYEIKKITSYLMNNLEHDFFSNCSNNFEICSLVVDLIEKHKY